MNASLARHEQLVRLIVAPGVDIAKEYYVGITIDRSRNTITMIASSEGGVEIEEVAHKSPEKVLKEPLHPMLAVCHRHGQTAERTCQEKRR